LVEGHEVVETLEDAVRAVEVFAFLAVLEPVPGEGLLGFGGLTGLAISSRSSIQDFRKSRFFRTAM